MIRDDEKTIVTPTGIIDEALSDEYLEKLNEEVRLYRGNEHISESYSSGKERRRIRRRLELRKRKGRL